MRSILLFFVLILFIQNVFANSVKRDELKSFTGKLQVVTVDEENWWTHTLMYLNSSNDGTYRTIEFAYESGLMSGDSIVAYGYLEEYNENEKVIVAENHTVLSLASESKSAMINTQFTGNRSLGVFVFKLQGDQCGFSDSKSSCSHCTIGQNPHEYFYNSSEGNIKEFYNRASDGKLNLLVNSTSIFDIVTTDTPTNLYGSMDSIVKNKVGVNPNDYDHAVFILPRNWYKVSPFTRWSVRGVGETPGRRIWINSCYSDTVAHELGHNFNFGHSNGFNSGGIPQEYLDGSSVMSFGAARLKRLINSRHRDLNGWLSEKDVVRTSQPGNWTLNALSTDGLRVVIFNYENVDYYIEFRQKIGYDIGLDKPVSGGYPKGNYYDSVLVRVRELTSRGREDTSLLAILELNSQYSLGKNMNIVHSHSLGNVTIGSLTLRNETSINGDSSSESTKNILNVYLLLALLITIVFI